MLGVPVDNVIFHFTPLLFFCISVYANLDTMFSLVFSFFSLPLTTQSGVLSKSSQGRKSSSFITQNTLKKMHALMPPSPCGKIIVANCNYVTENPL